MMPRCACGTKARADGNGATAEDNATRDVIVVFIVVVGKRMAVIRTCLGLCWLIDDDGDETSDE